MKKKKQNVWAVLNDLGEISTGLILEPHADCPCQGGLYNVLAIFETKKEAIDYKSFSQSVIKISLLK